MKFHRFSALVVGLVVALPGQHAMAWGDEGHEIVATIAYARLTPVVKKKIDSILAADKDKLTAPDFSSRATWADKWRDSDRNTTRVRYLATHNWHFVDIEIDSPDFDKACFNHPPLPAGKVASKGPADDCVVDKIEQFTAELRSSSTSKAERRLALKYLLHFVGDLHQPLHGADNHHDAGGNAVLILFGNHKVSSKSLNLHHYWDTDLVLQLGKDQKAVADQLNNQISPQDAATWSTGTPKDWAMESFDRAKTIAYDLSGESNRTDKNGKTVPYLDATYDNRALPVVREQLSKGGVRLAAVLNDALK